MAENIKKDSNPASGASPNSVKEGKGNNVALFGKDIEIYLDQPLPEYSRDENKAYRAKPTFKMDGGLFAIVCASHMLPRRNDSSVYSSIVSPSLPGLVAYGKAYCPKFNQERYVLIYKDVLGKPLLAKDQTQALGWSQERVMSAIVRPMVDVLQDFRDRDFVHGSIRPSNIYDGRLPAEQLNNCFLGDALSTPSSYTQPTLYETIERSLADPIGRGTGTLPDDLYSFGVTLAVFLRTQDPLAGLSEDDVVREKMRHGTYAAITGKDRFKGSILELLRGLLHDDMSQRWTIDEVLVWMDGRRLSPKQALKRKSASRPFVFNEQKFHQAPILAMALETNPAETVRIVDDLSLVQWVERSLEDDSIVGKIEDAKNNTVKESRGAVDNDLLVANLSVALDPMAPIRYKNVRVMGDGIGAALHEAIVLKKDFSAFIDMFMRSVVLNWVTASENQNLDHTDLISKADSCRGYLRQTKAGYGIERCLYMLAPGARCLSSKLLDYCVFSPEDMMAAFEDVCKKGNAPSIFLDRHSIAFLSVHDSRCVDGYLYDLDSAEEYKKILANLKCLATIQKRYKLTNFPAIAKAFLAALPVAVDRFHDKQVREKVDSNLKKFANTGDLVKMAGVLDNKEVQQKDLHGFGLAVREYSDLRDEKINLQSDIENDKNFGKGAGQEFAALISSGLAMVIIVVVAFMFVAG